MNNSDEFFLKQMKGVDPLKKKNKIKKESPNLNYKPLSLQQSKKKQTIQNNIKLSNSNNKIKNSEYNLEKVDLKKSIKKRLFHIDKKIDFHGQTLVESEEKFNNTVLECYNGGKRCLLFVTGKGLFKSKDKESIEKPKLYHGIIRSSFVEWAKSKKLSKYILSFEQASKEHGGEGAFYVYLRKKKTNFTLT